MQCRRMEVINIRRYLSGVLVNIILYGGVLISYKNRKRELPLEYYFIFVGRCLLSWVNILLLTGKVLYREMKGF